VTHDQAEAFAIADRVVVMNAGHIEQVGRPTELYRRPATAFVARFLGMENILPATPLSATPPRAQTSLGPLVYTPAAAGGPPAHLLIRPEAAHLLNPGEEGENVVHGRVQDCSFRGRYQIVTVLVAGEDGEGETAVSLKLEFDSDEHLPDVGQPVQLSLDPRAIYRLE
ncbi:MAG: TOBE domain-containing protein, partial [Anaerolineales bacterium]|nr:TOBE domain-containing protein [Anaerolineales bacterium]